MAKVIRKLNIILADDDRDDVYFFEKALSEVSIPTTLRTVENGAKLMNYLNGNALPDILFLDINMPCKNGMECLLEIKANKKLENLIVIMHSTSLREDVSNMLYEKGAYYFIRKTNLTELAEILQSVLSSLVNTKFARPAKKDYIIAVNDAHSQLSYL